MSAFTPVQKYMRKLTSRAPGFLCLKKVGTVSTQLEPDSYDKKVLTARLLITPFQLGLRGKGWGREVS